MQHIHKPIPNSSTGVEMKLKESANKLELATYLARELGDEENLACYVALTSRYSRDYLEDTLAQVKSVPEEQIRKSRGALYVYLLKYKSS